MAGVTSLRGSIAAPQVPDEKRARRVLADAIASDFAKDELLIIQRSDPAELIRWALRMHVALCGLLAVTS